MLALALVALLQAPADVPRVDETPARAGEWGFRPADGARVERTPPAFAWRPQPGAVAYELEVARGGGPRSAGVPR